MIILALTILATFDLTATFIPLRIIYPGAGGVPGTTVRKVSAEGKVLREKTKKDAVLHGEKNTNPKRKYLSRNNSAFWTHLPSPRAPLPRTGEGSCFWTGTKRGILADASGWYGDL